MHTIGRPQGGARVRDCAWRVGVGRFYASRRPFAAGCRARADHGCTHAQRRVMGGGLLQLAFLADFCFGIWCTVAALSAVRRPPLHHVPLSSTGVAGCRGEHAWSPARHAPRA